MKSNTEKPEFEYLSNFEREEMESILKMYGHYLKQTNLVSIPGFLMLGMIWGFRMLHGSAPRDQMIPIVSAAIAALLIWLFFMVHKLIQQKKAIESRLKNYRMFRTVLSMH